MNGLAVRLQVQLNIKVNSDIYTVFPHIYTIFPHIYTVFPQIKAQKPASVIGQGV